MAQPVEGELYRHFKGGLYRIVTIAQHTETSEGLVIYRSEEDPSKVWARPVVNFLSPVDKVKYPDATQDMRFEKVVAGQERKASQPATQAAPEAKAQTSETEGLDPEVEDFLDAKSSADRLHILSSLNHTTDENGMRTYTLSVHNSRFEYVSDEKIEEIKEALEGLSFSDPRCTTGIKII